MASLLALSIISVWPWLESVWLKLGDAWSITSWRMNSNVAIPRVVIIYGLCVPIAMLMGYLLTTPLDLISVLGVTTVMGLLLVPVLLRWHHFLLILVWNATIHAFFLPGHPRFWMVLTLASVAFSILDRVMNKQKRLQTVPWLTAPLIVLFLVIFITARLRDGFGLTSLGGGTFGGRKYADAFLAILGYFALSWQKIPPHRALLYSMIFFLSGITHVVSNLAYSFQLYWLFWLFPIDNAVMQIQADYSTQDNAFSRLSGVAFGCMAPFCYLLIRHGVKGLFDFSEGFSFFPIRRKSTLYVNQPWRLIGFCLTIFISTFGGFRSMPILFVLMFCVQFFVEKLHRTRLFFILLGASIALATCLVPFTEKLPLVVQRAIAYLPVRLSAKVKFDAWASTDWRLRMWQVVVEEMPKYLVLGKGFGGNATDLYLVKESTRRGFISDFEGLYIAGDYHSGPLSVLVPLGIPGALAFTWLLVAGMYALYRNHRYGPPELQKINTFLFTFFVTQTFFYIFVYGAFTNGLAIFTGTLGLSISLNGGVARKSREPLSAPALEPVKPAPGALPPTGALQTGAPA